MFGSRQAGKTTTADYLFGNEFGFVSLEPGLLNGIKRIVDEQRRIWMRNGEQRRLIFVLTGSDQFELQEGVSESLAGRTAVINMSGFAQTEKNR